MGNKHIILIMILLMLWCCNTEKPEKPHTAEGSNSETTSASNGSKAQHRTSMANLSKEELFAINRKLAVQVRENFRSWGYDHPERWNYLAENFADEVIRVCPESALERKQIAEVLLNYFKQRADIINSDSKEKIKLIIRSNKEYEYNLIFILGIKGYNSWLAFSIIELQKFNFKRDSLYETYSCLNNKIQKLK